MVAQTDIKYYVHTNHKAPQLENAYGSMLSVLDACLVNGFGSQTVDSLTANGTTVTADFGKAHNLLRFQVIKIDGAVQDEFNGEHRILEVTGNTITFEIATPATVERASGLINCSLPPLGWEKPFASVNPTGGGKGAYRSKNTLLPNRPFLRVVDELDPSYNADWAKYAKVGMVEDMLDIDTMMGQQIPFDVNNPQKNWVGDSTSNGWAKHYYAVGDFEVSSIREIVNPPNGSRSWVIVGNQDWFFILNRFHTNERWRTNHFPMFFGKLEDDYLNRSALVALLNNVRVMDHYTPYTECPLIYSDRGLVLLNQSSRLEFRTKAYTSGFRTGEADYMPIGENLPIVSSLVNIFEKTGMYCGHFPSIEWLYQKTPYQHLQTFQHQNHLKIAVGAGSGMVLFDLGNA